MVYRTLLLLVFLLPLTKTAGQNSPLQDLLALMEVQNGADNLLVNGRLYIPSAPMAEGHPYFDSKEWKAGRIYIKGKTFPVGEAKLDIFTNQLILKHQRSSGTVQNVSLSSSLVDSFQLDETSFINRRFFNFAVEEKGYLEVIYSNRLHFFRVQQKVLGPRSNVYPHGKFRALSEVFFLSKEGINSKISTKKDFLASFPEKKVLIRKYMKSQSMKWKKLTNDQFYQLLKYCDDQR